MTKDMRKISSGSIEAGSTMRHSILLVPGSTRNGSTNVAALRVALDGAGGEVTAVLFEGLADLPAFNPDDDYEPLPRAVAALRRQIASADGILFSSPECMGALPGSLKNLLDWTVGGPEMDGKPVAWINVAGEGRGLNARESLRTVLGYLGATVIEPAGRWVFVRRSAIGPDGTVHGVRLRTEIADVVRTFVDELGADVLASTPPRTRQRLTTDK